MDALGEDFTTGAGGADARRAVGGSAAHAPSYGSGASHVNVFFAFTDLES
jgi:hypothetical protein